MQTEPVPPLIPGTEGQLSSDKSRLGPSSLGQWLPWAAIVVLLVAIYFRVGIKLVYDWYTIPDYSHGFLVPFFAAFLIWDKRKVLKATPIKQTWSGIALIVLSLMVLILGVYGVELFTARMSF